MVVVDGREATRRDDCVRNEYCDGIIGAETEIVVLGSSVDMSLSDRLPLALALREPEEVADTD